MQDVSQGVNLYTRNQVAPQSDHFIDQQYKQITFTKIMVDFNQNQRLWFDWKKCQVKIIRINNVWMPKLVNF